MKIYFIRHGIASAPEGLDVEGDSQRPLTAEGRDKIGKIARALKQLDIKPDLILSSPYVRAEQTAGILAKEYDGKPLLKFSNQLTPDGESDAIISEIVENYMVDELFIVGHEPCLSLLIGTLLAADSDLTINLKKGGVCCLSVNDLHVEPRATIEWLVTPKILLKA
jgi:phosphohistidine phosphatase